MNDLQLMVRTSDGSWLPIRTNRQLAQDLGLKYESLRGSYTQNRLERERGQPLQLGRHKLWLASGIAPAWRNKVVIYHGAPRLGIKTSKGVVEFMTASQANARLGRAVRSCAPDAVRRVRLGQQPTADMLYLRADVEQERLNPPKIGRPATVVGRLSRAEKRGIVQEVHGGASYNAVSIKYHLDPTQVKRLVEATAA